MTTARRVGAPDVLLVILTMVGSAPALAQTPTAGVAGSFEQLQVLVRPGDRVTLTDAAGSRATGSIAELSSQSLALLVEGNRRQFRPDEVAAIHQRRADPLGNGALKGFWWGAAFGALGALTLCQHDDADCDWFAVPLIVGVYGAMGAGIGVAIDAAVRREQLIYERQSAASGDGIRAIRAAAVVRLGW
jgi:hypothetical protein